MAQQTMLLLRVKEDGYAFRDVKIFIDNGVTGATLDRPAFKQMSEAIRRGEFQAVYVKDCSRIGRSVFDSQHWLSEVEKWGVKVISEYEGKLNFIDHARLMKMIEEIRQWVARL